MRGGLGAAGVRGDKGQGQELQTRPRPRPRPRPAQACCRRQSRYLPVWMGLAGTWRLHRPRAPPWPSSVALGPSAQPQGQPHNQGQSGSCCCPEGRQPPVSPEPECRYLNWGEMEETGK